MKVEHLTVGGYSIIRDTNVIVNNTVNYFRNMQVYNSSVIVNVPKTDLQVRITSTSVGTIFDIMKNTNVAFTNVCCFSFENKNLLIDQVKSLVNQLKYQGCDEIRQPKLDLFIYTIPVLPFSLSPTEIMICGEIELYIYYSLFLAMKTAMSKSSAH
jgi:hypothetical protein